MTWHAAAIDEAGSVTGRAYHQARRHTRPTAGRPAIAEVLKFGGSARFIQYESPGMLKGVSAPARLLMIACIADAAAWW